MPVSISKDSSKFSKAQFYMKIYDKLDEGIER